MHTCKYIIQGDSDNQAGLLESPCIIEDTANRRRWYFASFNELYSPTTRISSQILPCTCEKNCSQDDRVH